ncbi:MAG TPA: glycoside hydrolase family 15 protein, partial [Gammaproteobacteria bacterium]|nr:glycoside hydrolase family 15 protein [Gammaproteobacteria bacterium]
RYCWIRDSALTLYALLNAGYREEAESWRRWLLRAAAGHPEQLRIMYGISGERWLPELELTWLSGYENSSPVRIGNKAACQRQLDVYGELLDVLHAAREAELATLDEAWALQKTLLKELERAWREPDHGIWETRGPARAFTHSRVMSWVAFDRGIKSCERFKLHGPVDRWREIRAEIHEDVCANAFDVKRNTFVQSYGARELDAALLLIPQTGFLPADDPRIAGTVAAIERELVSGEGLVMRYTKDVEDPGREGAFLICSFWLADAYVMLGRIDDATRVFESMLELRNDLGLLSEEYDPDAKRLIGNFPQGFSHIGLINTAFNLVKAHGPAQQRSERVAPTASAGASAANAGRNLRATAKDGGSAANAGRNLRPST